MANPLQNGKERMLFAAFMGYLGGVSDGLNVDGNELTPDELDRILEIVKLQYRLHYYQVEPKEEAQNAPDQDNQI